MSTSASQHRIPDQNARHPSPTSREMPPEVLVPTRLMHSRRAAILFASSLLLILIPDDYAKFIGVVAFGYSMYYLALLIRARVVLSRDGLTCRGVGAEKTFPWGMVQTVRLTRMVHQGGMPVVGRFGVTVELTNGKTVLLPGFDSGQPEAMQDVVERIDHWRRS